MRFAEDLAAEEAADLKRLWKSGATPRVRQRAHAILLSAKGYKIDTLADIFEVRRDAVSAWLCRWEEGSGGGGGEDVLQAAYAGGAYDTWGAREAITEREATPVIPPRRSAKIKKHGNSGGPPLPRDEAIRYIRRHGRKKWKQEAGYHRRSLGETAVYRYKQLVDRFVEARTWINEQVEVKLGAKVMNKMTRLGMPQAVKVAV